MNQPLQTPDFGLFALPQAKPRLATSNGVRVQSLVDSRMEDSPAAARDKGSKASDQFEVWHHHVSLRSPGEMDLMLRLDRRR